MNIEDKCTISALRLMKRSRNFFTLIRSAFVTLLATGLLLLIFSCTETAKTSGGTPLVLPPKQEPRGYVCYRANAPVSADGILDEKDWSKVPWTEEFVDIQGAGKTLPRFTTRVKMLWDNTNLYFAAEIQEPHIWATLRQRDTIIFMDHDFEIFIDPDGDAHAYYELEVNAYGTPWDLFMHQPYRDGGPAIIGWDITGLKVGTGIDGSINNPVDTDKSWTVEVVMPLKALLIEWPGPIIFPKGGDKWRLNFSRVEWRTITENGCYKKELNPATGKPYPEDNWVWSPQGQINMHMPEMWGYLQFSEVPAGNEQEAFVPDPDLDLRRTLWVVYYAENDYFAKHKHYSSSLEEIGLKKSDFPDNVPLPAILATTTTFESFVPGSDKARGLTIYNDGRIVNLSESSEFR